MQSPRLLRFTFHVSRYLLVFALAAILFIPHASAQVVEIPDPNLRQAVRERLELPDQIPLTQLEILRLKRLTADEAEIENLTGLEYAINLEFLVLGANNIQGITPLAELKNLEFLILRDNPIDDLSPLSNLTQLTYINLAGVPITDLTPLANLTQLDELFLNHCEIRDITPLSNLTQLSVLRLAANQIVDISPLANLTALEKLSLEDNQIVDISPLANLIALKELRIHNNQITDFSPLMGLSLTHLSRDEECVLPSVPVAPRLENRSLPSVFQPWDDPTHNRATLSHLDRIALHDLHWAGPRHGVSFRQTAAGYQLIGNLERVRTTIDELRAKNPNIILLAEVRQRDAHLHTQYPEDWPYWVRDDNGNLVESSGYSGIYLIDTTNPAVQDIIVQQAIAVSQCGLYDGIFFDWWLENGGSLRDFSVDPPPFLRPPEAERAARLAILQRIRQAVPDDFLILCNQTRTKLELSAPYVNGAFMETFQDYEGGGYTYEGLAEIEDTLLWSENNLREPQINCLEGWGIPTEPPDSPANKQWMRVFTTMSLTLSDGFVLYNDGRKIFGEYDHQHWWYDFWDADLGQPIDPIAQRYENVEGLYIREFAAGWAVYNRSGKAQTITLPASATPVSDRGDNAASITHLLPDLDGEIYRKIRNPADVNGDWVVNILDLVQVANGLGTADPDPNGDGVVNLLDLVLVAQHFSQ